MQFINSMFFIHFVWEKGSGYAHAVFDHPQSYCTERTGRNLHHHKWKLFIFCKHEIIAHLNTAAGITARAHVRLTRAKIRLCHRPRARARKVGNEGLDRCRDDSLPRSRAAEVGPSSSSLVRNMETREGIVLFLLLRNCSFAREIAPE